MKFEHRIEINASVKEVYKNMLNPNLMLQWELNFTGFNPVKGQKRKIKSIANRIYTEPDGAITKIKEEVTEIKLNQLFAYQLTHDNFMTYVICRFLDRGDSTMLIEETNVKFRPAILGLIGFFMKWSMKKRRKTDLIKFKNIVEKD